MSHSSYLSNRYQVLGFRNTFVIALDEDTRFRTVVDFLHMIQK